MLANSFKRCNPFRGKFKISWSLIIWSHYIHYKKKDLMHACVLLFSSPSYICSATSSTHGMITFTIDGSWTSTNIIKIILFIGVLRGQLSRWLWIVKMMTWCKHHHIFKLHLKIFLKIANRNFLDNKFKRYHCKLNIGLFIKYTHFWEKILVK